MDIKVKYNNQLLNEVDKRYNNDKYITEEIRINKNSSINSLLNKLNINHKNSLIILVNKKMINNFDYQLKDGDKVAIMPLVFGG